MVNIMKSITIYDIAKEAGVSPATVSRILTGSTTVSEEKRQKVQKLIEKYFEYLSYGKIKNKSDKLAFYREWMYKIYLLEHKAAYTDVELLLNNNAWYSATRAIDIYQRYRELVKARDSVANAQINAEKIKANKEVKAAIKALERGI